MENLFLRVLNMSLSAAAVIAVVALVRLPLRSAPKKWRYFLWSAAGFRLCCPVSFKAVFSIFRLRAAVAGTAGLSSNAVQLPISTPASVLVGNPAAALPSAEAAPITPAAVPAAVTAAPIPAAEPVQLWPTLGVVLWLCGLGVMLALGIIRYIRMKRLLADAAALEKGVLATDRIRVPFILGLLPPRVYVPAGLGEEERTYVLAHERVHIRRGDHWIKLLAYFLLSIHWFNPAVWAAFFLMSRDMEMSCDERVLRELDGQAKAYSRTLLRFAEGRQFPAPAPLGFGESDAKSRIKNALRWKKPKLWITLAAIILCIAAVAACTADPKDKDAVKDTAGDTLCFVQTDRGIELRSLETKKSYGEILEKLSLTGFSYDEKENILSPEDCVFPGETLKIDMNKGTVQSALYTVPPKETQEWSIERALCDPGVLLGDGDGSYYRISGAFAGEPFRMTLRYTEADLLFAIQLDFYPSPDQEGAKKLFEDIQGALTAQLGKPSGEGSQRGVSAAAWLFPYGSLSLQMSERDNGDQSVIILLSGAMGAETPWSWSSTVKTRDIREAVLKSGSAQAELLLTEEQIGELTALLNAVPRDQVVGGRGIPSERVLELRDTGYALRFAGGVIELDGKGPGAAAAEPVWEIHDEALYAWLDSLWAGSLFGQSEDPLGLTLRAEDVTPTGCTLVFTQSGDNFTGDLITGAEYLLETMDEDGMWNELPGQSERVWYLIGYQINLNGTTTLETDWSNFFGAMADGHYRISKGILNSHDDGIPDSYRIFAEFELSCAAAETNPSDTHAAHDPGLGTGRFDVSANEYGTAANGTIEIYEKDKETLGVRLLADLQIGPEDWGGVAFYLPAVCRLESVSCTYPETDGAAADDPPVNVWTTAADNEKYTTMIEIGRDRSRNNSGGGTGTVVIEAYCPWDSSDPIHSLAFGVECGAEEKDGYAIMGVEHSEIIVEIRSP